MTMIASTVDRVARNTCEQVNARIREQTEANVARFAAAGSTAIEQRLEELDQEWDIERCLETMAPSLTLFGLFMGAVSNKRWLLLPFAVQSFFLQHALQGWCPPMPVLRRLGVRTSEEINEERMALKALRGDFRGVAAIPEVENVGQVDEAMAAVRR
jgi:hypothetical protein